MVHYTPICNHLIIFLSTLNIINTFKSNTLQHTINKTKELNKFVFN